eukprot:s1724_g17.t1
MGVECRIGEAKKPGPSEANQPCTWSLGVCNPSGLPGKSVLLSGIQAEVVAVSETHLTSVGRSCLVSSLRSHSSYSHVVTGAPLATRVNSFDAGQYSGVAVISQVPTRALCAAWPPDLYETGRVQITGSLVNNVWVTGGLVYGYPQSKAHPNALERTSLMLDFMFDHMTSVATGPRFLAGDWNHPMSQLAITQKLLQLGWREAQDVEYLRSGTPPQATCKGRTRVDVLWLSPELLPSFACLRVETDRFPDHVVLKAQFHVGPSFAVRYLWPTPSAIPWPKVHGLSCPVDFSEGSPTDLYQHMWCTAETSAKHSLGDHWTFQMQGRGQRTQPVTRKGWAVPPWKGRSSDYEPTFHGYSVHHARWLKQLRRLQNYHRWAKSHYGQSSSQQALHGLYLWKSVLQATGFRPSFASWWTSHRCAGLQDPCVVPDFPPSPDVACLLCEAFQGEVQYLERQLQAAKKSTRVAQHAAQPNLIYKDTRRPVPEPVTSLLHTVQAHVTEVDSDDVAVDFEPPCVFDVSKPVLVDEKPVRIIHATEDRLYLEDLPSVEPNCRLKQVRPLGALDEVFHAFHEQWRARWCRHDQIPHSHWQTLVDFARHHLPPHVIPPLTVSPALLRAEVASKKPHAATGLDGVSRLDILQSNDAMLQSLCNVCSRAEVDGCWPLQVLTGRVASLAKREGAASTQDYRPITVFSMLYRAYSSLQARMLLTFASEWCHPDIHGNRKNHQTSHLWRTIATSIQQAYDQQVCLSGLTADIEKCFNCLPRWPILAAAVQVGTPGAVMNAWTGGLAAMVRRFKVRDSYSMGFTTSTGLAEGCALSCYGMLLLDDIMHRWLAVQFPAIRALSFVDNWDFLTWDPAAAEQQLDALLQFTSLADLTVDMKKTYAWSTHAPVRQRLRARGLVVCHHAKDLGAHVAMSRQRTNSTVTGRLQSLAPLWQQLRSSKAGYRAKLRALRTVAWPRGLFAIESAPVGRSVWLTQRRQATQALQMDKAGVNPLLLLGLVESHADPEFLALVKTVFETCLHCPLDFWGCELAPFAHGLLACPPSSPTAVLFDRLQRVGFCVRPDGQLEDCIGAFHPALSNPAEVSNRLQWQWNRFVATEVQHRKDFGGLTHVDSACTRHLLASQSVEDQCLLRLSLSGALFAQDAHSNWNSGDGACKWCGGTDSLRHRYFQCPHTSDLRAQHAPDVVRLLGLLPDALVLRSWAIQPPTHLAFLRLLSRVSARVPDLACVFRPGVVNEVFTDGSCLWQSMPSYRIAAWGAVLAETLDANWSCTCSGILGARPVPGLCQTSYRGELFAVAFVLHHAALGSTRVKIYCDCLGVINRFHLLTTGQVRLKHTTANSDLWRWILDSMTVLGTDRAQLVKIAAHKPLAQSRSRREFWSFWHNHLVDQVAKHANLNRSSEFWSLWEQHVTHVHAAAELHRQVCALHVAVGKRSVQSDESATLDDAPSSVPRQLRELPMVFRLADWGEALPLAFTSEYGSGLASRVALWWNARTRSDSCGEVRWISFAHLYVDYQLTFGCPGPVKAGSRWLDAKTRPYLDPEKHPFLLRLKWFRRCLKVFWKSTNQTIGMATCRAEGSAIQSFVASASVCWDIDSWTGAEYWLATESKGPCARGTAALKALPLVKAQSRYALQQNANRAFFGMDDA